MFPQSSAQATPAPKIPSYNLSKRSEELRKNQRNVIYKAFEPLIAGAKTRDEQEELEAIRNGVFDFVNKRSKEIEKKLGEMVFPVAPDPYVEKFLSRSKAYNDLAEARTKGLQKNLEEMQAQLKTQALGIDMARKQALQDQLAKELSELENTEESAQKNFIDARLEEYNAYKGRLNDAESLGQVNGKAISTKEDRKPGDSPLQPGTFKLGDHINVHVSEQTDGKQKISANGFDTSSRADCLRTLALYQNVNSKEVTYTFPYSSTKASNSNSKEKILAHMDSNVDRLRLQGALGLLAMKNVTGKSGQRVFNQFAGEDLFDKSGHFLLTDQYLNDMENKITAAAGDVARLKAAYGSPAPGSASEKELQKELDKIALPKLHLTNEELASLAKTSPMTVNFKDSNGTPIACSSRAQNDLARVEKYRAAALRGYNLYREKNPNLSEENQKGSKEERIFKTSSPSAPTAPETEASKSAPPGISLKA